ncbi:MAG: hypothetical protein Kow0098_09000 [Ignavibacteriaceae bacterium]
MSGWLDWFEEEIECPHCGNKITVLFYEDGEPGRDPVVITGLAEDTICPQCKTQIKTEDIQ